MDFIQKNIIELTLINIIFINLFGYVYSYLIVTKNSQNNLISYVGYTNNLKKRLNLHNNSRGAKFTKGKFWRLIYFKIYKTKIKALKEEYKLKKDYKLRSNIKKKYLRNENINITTL